MRAMPRFVVRREGGLYAYEKALERAGLTPVAGADEAGRGACAGPLVVAAVVLPTGRRGQVPGLADSKLLTPQARDEVYDEVVARAAAWSVVVIPAGEVDRLGLHVCNIEGMRRALAQLAITPSYVLTDGFPVARACRRPASRVWKGDRVSASIAAASVLAKVTRDRIMVRLHESWPSYDFARAQGLRDAGAQRRAGRARPVPRAPVLLRQRRPPGAGGPARAGAHLGAGRRR